MDEIIQLLSNTSNGHMIALTILVRCLQNNGALKPDQYENALQATIDYPGAETKRADYIVLKNLLRLLQTQPPKDPARPHLHVIDGGKLN